MSQSPIADNTHISVRMEFEGLQGTGYGDALAYNVDGIWGCVYYIQYPRGVDCKRAGGHHIHLNYR